MSTKAIVISIAVIILALGMIGSAFATGMSISNLGVLSSGNGIIPQVDTDHVGFLSSPDGCGVNRVALSFNRDIATGSTIWVAVLGAPGDCPVPGRTGNVDEIAHGWKVMESFLSKDDEVIVELDRVLPVKDVGNSRKVIVTVAER